MSSPSPIHFDLDSIHPDDAKDKVFIAIVKALCLLCNKPSSPKELAATIIKNKLTVLGGATPYATVSSRISQHFRRVTEAKPSREPILGRNYSENHSRKIQYFLQSLPLPENPDAIPSLSLAAVTAELGSSSPLASTPRNNKAARKSHSVSKPKRKIATPTPSLQHQGDSGEKLCKQEHEVSDNSVDFTPEDHIEIDIEENSTSNAPITFNSLTKTPRRPNKTANLASNTRKRFVYNSEIDSSVDEESSTEYSSTSSDMSSSEMSSDEEIDVSSGNSGNGKSIVLLQKTHGKGGLSKSNNNPIRKNFRKKQRPNHDSSSKPSFMILPTVHPRIPQELTHFSSDSDCSSMSESSSEDSEAETMKKGSSSSSGDEVSKLNLPRSRTRTLSQTLKQMVITKAYESSEESSDSMSDLDEAVCHHLPALKNSVAVEIGSNLSPESIMQLSSLPNTYPCLISVSTSPLSTCNVPDNLKDGSLKASPQCVEHEDFHQEMLGQGDFEHIFDLDKSTLERRIAYSPISNPGSLPSNRPRSNTLNDSLHLGKRRLTLTLLDPSTYLNEELFSKDSQSQPRKESECPRINISKSTNFSVSNGLMTPTSPSFLPLSGIEKLPPTIDWKNPLSPGVVESSHSNESKTRRRRPTLTILDPIKLDKELAQVRSLITFHDDPLNDQDKSTNDEEQKCFNQPGPGTPELTSRKSCDNTNINIMIPTIKPCIPMIHVTAIDTWLVYVTDIPMSSVEVKSPEGNEETDSNQQEVEDVTKSNPPTIRLLRRVDNGWVHAPSLLKAGGICEESVRSMILSLESKKVLVKGKKPKSLIPAGEDQIHLEKTVCCDDKSISENNYCTSLLHGIWIPLERARSHAATSSIEHRLGAFLSDQLHLLFPNVIMNPAVTKMLRGVAIYPNDPKSSTCNEELNSKGCSDTETASHKREGLESAGVGGLTAQKTRNSRSLTLSAVDSSISKAEASNHGYSLIALTPPASPHYSSQFENVTPKMTISFPVTMRGINNFRRQNSSPMLPSEVLYEEHIARATAPSPNSLFVTHHQILLNPESDPLLMSKVAEMNKKKGVKRRRPAAPKKPTEERPPPKKARTNSSKMRPLIGKVEETQSKAGNPKKVPIIPSPMLATSTLPCIRTPVTVPDKGITVSDMNGGNDSEEVEIVAVDDEDKMNRWRVSILTPIKQSG